MSRNVFRIGVAVALAVLLIIGIAAYRMSQDEPKKEAPESIYNPNTDPNVRVEPTDPPSIADTRPNVMLIMVDDMRVADLPYMPKLQSLLTDRGTYFPNMLSPNPTCCPARAGFMTAQYTHNNGVFTNFGYYGGLDALRTPDDTVAVWLQEAGYSTGYFGKYMNGYSNTAKEAIPLGWDWWDATGKNTYSYTYFQFANNGVSEEFTGDYITTRLRQRSDDLIRRFSAERDESGKPFFIFDSYVAPHGAIRAEKDLKAELGSGPIPEEKYRGLYLDERNPSEDKPSFQKMIKNYPVRGNFVSDEYTRTTENLQNQFIRRIQSLASVDDAIEQTVATLKETGQYDNTVFMFLSDNGYLMGEHKRFGKQVALKESIQVPLIIAGPGFAQGVTSQRWATAQDVAATVLDLAQAKPHQTIDGVSLKGAAAADPVPTEAIVVENGNPLAESSADEPWSYRGVLLGARYSYTKWYTSGRGEELYDNERDPYQLVNVATDPRYAAVVKLARQKLAAMKDCVGPGSCTSAVDALPEVLTRKEVKKRSSKRR